ncbi:hypothetical protein PG993_000706 [Apiospora rasikravindrae]|uniref:HNH nuclease domain-containing protein n=1 Tax=Apiospora rasikravindrae TaxID=990691 RepID=A0ABR1U9D6_9PEZI
MSSPAITSTYLRNEKPPGDGIPPDDAPRHLKKQFAAAEFAKQRISELTNMNHSNKRRAAEATREVTNLRALLPLLQCPEAYIESLPFDFENQHRYDKSISGNSRTFLAEIEHLFTKAKELNQLLLGTSRLQDTLGSQDDIPEENEDVTKGIEKPPTDKGKGKMKAKRTIEQPEAQKTVPEWYGKRCVFTHTTKPVEGAHIIAHHISDKNEVNTTRLMAFENTLSLFFRDSVIKSVIKLLSGDLTNNILPLDKSTHFLWNQCHLAIRPIPSRSPDDEGKRLEIQFLRLSQDDPMFRGSIIDIRDQLQDEAGGILCDSTRRHDTDEKPPIRIQTGDVYLLETTDPDKYPLPSFELLNIAYHLQSLQHGIKSWGALHTLFNKPAPDSHGAHQGDQPDPSSDFLESIIEDAMTPNELRSALISEEAGWSWIIALRELAAEERKEELEALKEYMSEAEDENKKPVSQPRTTSTPTHRRTN